MRVKCGVKLEYREDDERIQQFPDLIKKNEKGKKKSLILALFGVYWV
jgi:hypothetical protein